MHYAPFQHALVDQSRKWLYTWTHRKPSNFLWISMIRMWVFIATLCCRIHYQNKNKAYSLVLHHEKQLEVTTGKSLAQPEAAAFAVKNSSHETETEQRCSRCNKTNHNTKDCRAHLRCTFYRWKGHTAEYCRKKTA